MDHRTSRARQRGRGVIATILLAMLLGGGLIYGLYWWSVRPAPDAVPAAVTPGTLPSSDTAPVAPGDAPARRAEAAMQETRMFVPPGDNAFELYLQVTDADPGNQAARNALDDLFPYALLYIEERLAEGDVADAERMLGLMRRADANAPALPRLVDALADLRTRQAEAQAQAENEAERPPVVVPIAAVPATTPPATLQTAAPTAAPIAPPATAPRTSAVAVAEEQAREQILPPAEPSRVISTTAAVELPRVLSSAQARYPVIAMRRKLEGQVELAFTVRPDGSVDDVRVLSSEPDDVFDREAVAAMERWRFAPQPAESHGRRVFDFRLN